MVENEKSVIYGSAHIIMWFGMLNIGEKAWHTLKMKFLDRVCNDDIKSTSEIVATACHYWMDCRDCVLPCLLSSILHINNKIWVN